MTGGDGNELAKIVRRTIEQEGAIPVARYMALCLGHPQHGYYVTRDPLGAAGDFTTAPEISQMFGELLGLWAVVTWQLLGAPAPFSLIELGPGRGTLMADALRAAGGASRPFADAARVHLVETSPALRARQAAALPGADPVWHDRFEEVPDGPFILFANEFLDALPVCQYIRANGQWCERMVGLDEGGDLAFVASGTPAAAALSLGLPEAADGTIFEVCWPALSLADKVADRANRVGGAALFIDYGYDRSAPGDTLQAVRAHRFHPVLQEPGTADLTAHVDFGRVAGVVRERGATAWGPIAQGVFLRRLGIEARAAILRQKADKTAKAAIESACNRLIGDAGMGNLFRVMAVTGAAPAELPGFLVEERAGG